MKKTKGRIIRWIAGKGQKRSMGSPYASLPEELRVQAEAHAFRALVAHLQVSHATVTHGKIRVGRCRAATCDHHVTSSPRRGSSGHTLMARAGLLAQPTVHQAPPTTHHTRCVPRTTQERPDVQNMELMTQSGFCRNCLAKWLLSGARQLAPLPLAEPLTYDDATHHVYGIPYKQWKKQHQTAPTDEQMARYNASKSLHAKHGDQATSDVDGGGGVGGGVGGVGVGVGGGGGGGSGGDGGSSASAATAAGGLAEFRNLSRGGGGGGGVELDPCCPDPTDDVAVTGQTCPPQPPQSAAMRPLAPRSTSASASSAPVPHPPSPPPITLKVGVLTISDRVVGGVYEDQSGPMIQTCLRDYER